MAKNPPARSSKLGNPLAAAGAASAAREARKVKTRKRNKRARPDPKDKH
jgi:hypothetical protein